MARSFRVKHDAEFHDMSSERFGQPYPAPHQGEAGVVVNFFDDMPVLRFADGDEEQFPLSSLEEVA